ncbi:alpha/beta hydrolase [bacterium SCSIO 12741]|nr:alpha/beta hydrolase [bacterium SCSIO 12741]
MKKRSLKTYLYAVTLSIFTLVNVVAFNQAWHFTHFQPKATKKTKKPEELSTVQKVAVLLTGIENPKPTNDRFPDLPYETITYSSHEHQLSAWIIPHEESSPVVVLFHGYTGKKSDLLDEALEFYKLGYTTVLVDFFGSGNSDGERCTLGYLEAEDVKNTCITLDSLGFPAPILYGQSMGAVAIMRAVAECEVKPQALILESPYHTLRNTVKSRFEIMGAPTFVLPELLVFWGGVQNRFNGFKLNTEEYAISISCPTLILQGTKDHRAGIKTGHIIQQNIQGHSRLVELEAAHQSLLNLQGNRWRNEVDLFLNPLFKTDKTQAQSSHPS